MLNILSVITIAENEKGELGVGLDLQQDEETLKKLQEILPKLAKDVSNMTIDDVNVAMRNKQYKNFILEEEIKNKIKTIDIDKCIEEDLLAREMYDNILTDIFKGSGLPSNILDDDNEDIKYIQNELYKAFGVPREYLELKREVNTDIFETVKRMFHIDSSIIDNFKKSIDGGNKDEQE